jgi:hypothetical protein
LATVGCETPAWRPYRPDALPDLTNQIGNQFNIIINQFTPVRFTDLAKTFDMLFNIHQLRRFFIVGLPARRFIVLPQWGDASSARYRERTL